MDINKIDEMVAEYHVRDGTDNVDGSTGRIEITPKQFKELLIEIIENGIGS